MGVKAMLAGSVGILGIGNSKFLKTSSSVRNINFWNTSSDFNSLMGLADQVAFWMQSLVKGMINLQCTSVGELSKIR